MPLCPMQAMKRHFSKNTYDHFYALFRRAYRIGGDDLVRQVYNCAYDARHAYYPQGLARIRAAYITFSCR